MNRITFRTVELHKKNEYNGSVENNRAADKRIEAFKYRSEKITWNAKRKKEMQNIKSKLNMIYIEKVLHVNKHFRQCGDNGKKAMFQIMIVDNYFLFRVKKS